MLIKFICCDVFTRIACDLISKSPHIIDVVFIPMLAHVEPDNLRELIRDEIAKTEESRRPYDAIVIGFGLCGNTVLGLTSSIEMVIPRAHDCCTMLMGSKERFIEAFGHSLSTRWCSTGYFERTRAMRDYSSYISSQQDNYKTSAQYMRYVEEYDEETADYLWETLHPKIETDETVYIRIDGHEYSNSQETYIEDIEKLDLKVRVVDGDISMLKALLDGDWDDERFLIVPPGKSIIGIYDMDIVMSAQ